MSLPFNCGDRVRVVRRDPDDFVALGAIGTVLEEDLCPWIRFDEPVSNSDYPSKLPGWRRGYMDCLEVEQLELLVEPAPANDCPEPHHAHHHDERAHKLHHWKERLACLGLCTALHVVLELVSHFWIH